MYTTDFRNVHITAAYYGAKPAPWNGAGRENWNHHRITLRNRDTKARTAFDFWGSLADPEIHDVSGLMGALACFVSDAMSGDQSFSSFCGEYGYDEDSRSAERTWKACRRSREKCLRVFGILPTELYGLWEELEENGWT